MTLEFIQWIYMSWGKGLSDSVRDRLFDNFKVSFDLKRKPYNLRARAARTFDPRVDNGDPQMATQSALGFK